MRHQHLLIRRLALLLRSRMTTQGHLAQMVVQEGRGNCLPPRAGCSAACREAQELVALTEPYLPTAAPKPPRAPMRPVVLKRPPRPIRRTVKPSPPSQAPLFGEAAG